MSIQAINFKDTQSDIAVLNRAIVELQEKGLSPNEATAHILASMANQAMMHGLDPKEAVDAMYEVISGGQSKGQEKKDEPVRMRQTMTSKQVDELHAQMNALRDLLLYWDVVLCSEIQRYAYEVKDRLKEKNLYRHELKKCTNRLIEEARQLQMRIKDNDRTMVLKWCMRIDKRGVFAPLFFDQGGTVTDKFVLSYQKVFKLKWNLVMLDCREACKASGTNQKEIVTVLRALEALTNTGIELYDSCVKRMKRLMTGKGTFNIRKSLHHESMRNAVYNLIQKLAVNPPRIPETQMRYAREHLAALQVAMIEEGMGDFFRSQFEVLSEEFVDYMMASMRMGIQERCVPVGAVRMVFERLGAKQKVRKFFHQLSTVEYPDGEDIDVHDVTGAISGYGGNRSEMNRFKKMCIEGSFFEQSESEDQQEARALRGLARRNGYMLPDDILRVMIMHHKTKKALVDKLSGAGFELAPTLRRIRKMKVDEIKQL